jgi:PPE-repeat protein
VATTTTPYATWLSALAAQAEQAATQAEAAVAAFETAFAMTVPPSLVAANRGQLMSLVADNILGQNSLAIETIQAEYAEMWAQDAAAMYDYVAASEAASTLTPFTQPPKIVDSAVAASVDDSAEANTQVTAEQLAAPAAPALPGLASPAPSASAISEPSVLPAESTTVLTPIGELDIVAVYIATIGTGSLAAAVTNAAVNTARPWATNGSGSTGDDEEDEQEKEPTQADLPASEVSVLLSAQNTAGSVVSAGVSQAAMVGALSVPHGWTTAAPEIRLAVSALPNAGLEAVSADIGGMPAGALGGMALAGLAGRDTGSTGTRSVGGTAPEGEDEPKRKPTVVVIQKPQSSGGLTGKLPQ